MQNLIEIRDDDIEKMDKLYMELKSKYLLVNKDTWNAIDIFNKLFPTEKHKAYEICRNLVDSGLIYAEINSSIGGYNYGVLVYGNNEKDRNFTSYKKEKEKQKKKARRETISDFEYYLGIATKAAPIFTLLLSLSVNLYQCSEANKKEKREGLLIQEILSIKSPKTMIENHYILLDTNSTRKDSIKK